MVKGTSSVVHGDGTPAEPHGFIFNIPGSTVTITEASPEALIPGDSWDSNPDGPGSSRTGVVNPACAGLPVTLRV